MPWGALVSGGEWVRHHDQMFDSKSQNKHPWQPTTWRGSISVNSSSGSYASWLTYCIIRAEFEYINPATPSDGLRCNTMGQSASDGDRCWFVHPEIIVLHSNLTSLPARPFHSHWHVFIHILWTLTTKLVVPTTSQTLPGPGMNLSKLQVWNNSNWILLPKRELIFKRPASWMTELASSYIGVWPHELLRFWRHKRLSPCRTFLRRWAPNHQTRSWSY